MTNIKKGALIHVSDNGKDWVQRKFIRMDGERFYCSSKIYADRHWKFGKETLELVKSEPQTLTKKEQIIAILRNHSRTGGSVIKRYDFNDVADSILKIL